jgi:hypothetical protein
MKKDDARNAIVSEWRRLHADKRATEHQAFSFAMQAIQQYKWRPLSGSHGVAFPIPRTAIEAALAIEAAGLPFTPSATPLAA